MKLTEVLKRAGELYPHNYGDEELLGWCWELTNEIADKYKKLYGVVEWEAPDKESQTAEFVLPPGILWEDVDAVYVDGRKAAKVDARSFQQEYAGKNVKLVYRIRPELYGNPVISEEAAGEFNVDGKCITIPAAVQFSPGDRLEIWRGDVDSSAEKPQYRVFDFAPETYTYTLDVAVDTSGTGLYHVQRILDAATPVPPPFDMMYIDYVLAKICYYQNDLEGYNKHMSMVNGHMNDYSYWYKQTNPIRQTRFLNRW